MKIWGAEIDKGRLHIGYLPKDSLKVTEYGRNIKVYSKGSRSAKISRLFGKSTIIKVHGDRYCVNNKSLINHLKSIGVKNPSKQISEIRKSSYDAFIEDLPMPTKHGMEFSTRNRSGETVIWHVKRNGDKIELDEGSRSISKEARERLSYDLMDALLANNSDLAEACISKGALLNQKCNLFKSKEEIYSGTPLAYAIQQGNARIAALILEAKKDDITGDFFERNCSGETVIWHVKRNGDNLELVEASRSISKEARERLTYDLMNALSVNDLDLAENCIKRGALLNQKFYYVYNERRFGSGGCRWTTSLADIGEIYWKGKASVFSCTPLAFAIIKGNKKIAKLIFEVKQGDISADFFKEDVYIWGVHSHDFRKIKNISVKHVRKNGDNLELLPKLIKVTLTT